ncbi:MULTISPECIES: HDOD domain-containing protein [Marinobacter]|uniref:HD-like signal output (HDOD) domain, no enzymatic activity n=1 Tax=Marinobacter segnicrescens TaxID=430453 RepID=A0A1I0F0H0_9GAMM|nr:MULTISPECIES: HDOD domain-containing protein [Marinobacter]UZD64804.1 HDOD domain-containing protein [Marinobacter sp. AN1]SET51450.1 HD-like signal output (HDOD) domain, no enzymatic activity [Marinobacter segnicrescens]
MSNIVDTIRDDILSAIESDKLILPTLPEVALQVRDIAESEDSSIMDLVRVISNDTALSARLIRVCNSPLFRGSRAIENLNMAVSRLGMAYTSNLAMGLAMEQMFQATSDMVDKRLRANWQTSTEVAGICHVLAQQYTRLKPDQATLAGLVHMIGVLPILRYVEDQDVQISSIMLDNVIDELHPRIGTSILKRWDFPEDLQMVPLEYQNYQRQVASADYADLVMVANLQLLAGTDHPVNEMDWSTISAFDRLGLDPNANLNDEEDLNAQMEAAMALLK